MLGSFVTSLLFFRISKGLSEKVFAKYEEEKKTSAEVRDAGKVDSLNLLDLFCAFRIISSMQADAKHLVPYPTSMQIGFSTWNSAHLLRSKLIAREYCFSEVDIAGGGAHAFNPSRQRQVDLSDFKDSQGYTEKPLSVIHICRCRRSYN